MVGKEMSETKKLRGSVPEQAMKVQHKLRKRKRSDIEKAEPVDDSILRILTGKENSEQGSEDDGLKDDQVDDGSPVEEPETDEPPEPAEAQGSTQPASASVAEVTPAVHWSRPLSETHAKKIKITVLLEKANLETVKQNGRSGGVALLNCEDHRHVLKKTGREANDARPDITHQCLLALMDSPLNKAGRLKVYIRTAKNVLIDVHPQTRVPRTIRRFSGLMAELLEKFKVRGTSGSTPLLRVIRNPITSHLPVGTRKIVCTYNTENVVDMREHAAKMVALAAQGEEDKEKLERGEQIDVDDDSETVNVLYVIGAMAHGKVTEDWADDYICVSEYPLSAATVCSRLTYTYECLFGIL